MLYQQALVYCSLHAVPSVNHGDYKRGSWSGVDRCSSPTCVKPSPHRYTSVATDIPEACELDWIDDFYSTDQDQDIVAVFDIHYDRLPARLWHSKFVVLGASFVALLVAVF